LKEVVKEEYTFDKKQLVFEQEHCKVTQANDALQEELDKYCIEKETFDRFALQIKQQGEQDEIESEKIGYFKANKNTLKEQLKKLRQDLETEK